MPHKKVGTCCDIGEVDTLDQKQSALDVKVVKKIVKVVSVWWRLNSKRQSLSTRFVSTLGEK